MSDISGASVVNAAEAAIGVIPYVWGGMTQLGADCSGFVKLMFADQGVTINGRDTEQQAADGTAVPLGPSTDPLEYAVPGDVVFFGLDNASLDDQHEGIYIGNNEMIDEPHSGLYAEVDPVIGWDASEPLSAIRSFIPATDASADPNSTGVNAATTDTVPSDATAETTSVLSNAGTSIIDGIAYLVFLAAGIGLVGVGIWKLANPGQTLTTSTSAGRSTPTPKPTPHIPVVAG